MNGLEILQRRPTADGLRIDDGIEACVEVDVERRGRGLLTDEATNATALGFASAGQVEHDPASQATRQSGQITIGGLRHLGQEFERVVWCLVEEFLER